MATKTPNYTSEQVAYMVETYDAEPTRETVDRLATELGKSARSVIAKLARETTYVKEEKPKAAAKQEGPTKGEMLTTLAKIAPTVDVDGLAGANKAAIQSVIDLVEALSETDYSDEEE